MYLSVVHDCISERWWVDNRWIVVSYDCGQWLGPVGPQLFVLCKLGSQRGENQGVRIRCKKISCLSVEHIVLIQFLFWFAVYWLSIYIFLLRVVRSGKILLGYHLVVAGFYGLEEGVKGPNLRTKTNFC